MTQKQKFFEFASQHGIDVDYTPRDEGGAAMLNLWAPCGKVFASSGCHVDSSIDSLTDSGSIEWKQAFAQLQKIIGFGLDECPDMPNCDSCNP